MKREPVPTRQAVEPERRGGRRNPAADNVGQKRKKIKGCLAIQQRDADFAARPGQAPGRRQPAESAPYDYNVFHGATMAIDIPRGQ